MKESDKKIYTMISSFYKLDQGKGVFPDVLVHNMKTITGINISDNDIKDFLKTDILTTGYDNDNRPTVLLSSGAQSYLDNIDEAWLIFPEMRTAFKDDVSAKMDRQKHDTNKLKNSDDPIAKLLLYDDIICEKNEFINNYMHYLDEGIITSSDFLNINIDISHLDDGLCPICEKRYEILKKGKEWHIEHKHSLNLLPKLNLLSKELYIYHEKDKKYYLKTIKDSFGQRTVVIEVGKDEVQFPKKTSIRRSYHLYRGKNFWETAANFLKENNILFAKIKITDKDLEKIRQYFPEFNKSQPAQICPIGIDKEKCDAAWKETESIIYQKQKDIPGAKLFLSAIYPEINVKPKDNEMIHIDMETFKDIHLILQEGNFEKKSRRGTKEELRWYDYFYTVENNDGILIDVPSYLKDKKEEGNSINLNDVKITLFKKKIEPLYQQICSKQGFV